ncbi:MAG: hypothetical protein ABIC95_04065 [archaeon]
MPRPLPQEEKGWHKEEEKMRKRILMLIIALQFGQLLTQDPMREVQAKNPELVTRTTLGSLINGMEGSYISAETPFYMYRLGIVDSVESATLGRFSYAAQATGALSPEPTLFTHANKQELALYWDAFSLGLTYQEEGTGVESTLKIGSASLALKASQKQGLLEIKLLTDRNPWFLYLRGRATRAWDETTNPSRTVNAGALLAYNLDGYFFILYAETSCNRTWTVAPEFQYHTPHWMLGGSILVDQSREACPILTIRYKQ